MPSHKPAVIVMAKVPEFSQVKTRLRPLLSEDQCNSLATSFLLDTISALEQSFENILIAFTPEGGRDHLGSLTASNHRLIAQTGIDLGDRMQAAVGEALSLGFGPIVVVGSDSPNLPPTYAANAAEYLLNNTNGVTIGPTDDGGYYLIGFSSPIVGIFKDIVWGSDTVLEKTLANIRANPNLKLQVLPSWYDIDEPVDLLRLRHDLNSTIRLAANTRQWLDDNKSILDISHPIA